MNHPSVSASALHRHIFTTPNGSRWFVAVLYFTRSEKHTNLLTIAMGWPRSWFNAFGNGHGQDFEGDVRAAGQT